LDESPAHSSPAPAEVPDAPLSPARSAELSRDLFENIERAVRGKPEVVRRSLITLLAGGHLLLEDVPGVGKTTLARAIAHSIDGCFHRVQFTSDLLPSDLLGLSLPEFSEGRAAGNFSFQPGPIFANVVLADEVNRASPKSQSALLEAMSERSVSVDGVTHPLPDPFFVVATQNPLEHHGTHPLPESQLDRFLMRLSIGYPEKEFEAQVLLEDPASNTLPKLRPVVQLAELRAMQQTATRVKFSEGLVAYLLDIVEATREHEALELGASPRATVSLRRAAQARAVMEGRDFCIPEDVRELTVDVFSHRVLASTRGGAPRGADETRWILREVLERVTVPL
jgi:MoxR-like ATPase